MDTDYNAPRHIERASWMSEAGYASALRAAGLPIPSRPARLAKKAWPQGLAALVGIVSLIVSFVLLVPLGYWAQNLVQFGPHFDVELGAVPVAKLWPPALPTFFELGLVGGIALIAVVVASIGTFVGGFMVWSLLIAIGNTVLSWLPNSHGNAHGS